jgi:hypothetical protein
MARPKTSKSKSSLLNLGLKQEEDKELIKLTEAKGISPRSLCRVLLRQWMAEGGEGVLKYSKR